MLSEKRYSVSPSDVIMFERVSVERTMHELESKVGESELKRRHCSRPGLDVMDTPQ
jgi:hypothetical protein